MAMRTLTAVSAALAFLALADPGRAAETLAIPGSGSSQTLLRTLAAAFNAANPDVVVEVPDSIGTGGGMKAAGEGQAVIAQVGRRPGPKEEAYGLQHTVFAIQPVVFAAHPGVGIKMITTGQSRDLFAGAIANWKQIGGPDLAVKPIVRSPGETNLAAIQKLLPEWKDIAFPADAPAPKTDQENIALIAETPGAIGFNVISEILDAGLTPLLLGVKAPTEVTYPLFIEAVLVHKPGALAGAARRFVDFVLGPEGGKIIKANNAFPVRR